MSLPGVGADKNACCLGLSRCSPKLPLESLLPSPTCFLFLWIGVLQVIALPSSRVIFHRFVLPSSCCSKVLPESTTRAWHSQSSVIFAESVQCAEKAGKYMVEKKENKNEWKKWWKILYTRQRKMWKCKILVAFFLSSNNQPRRTGISILKNLLRLNAHDVWRSSLTISAIEKSAGGRCYRSACHYCVRINSSEFLHAQIFQEISVCAKTML